MQTRTRLSRYFIVAVAGILSTGSGITWAQASQPAAGVPVRQVDHIMIESDQPEKIFQLFREKLELPQGWPFRSYGTFSSGGVGFGNVILELIHLDGEHPGITGVAFEPVSIPDAVAGLDARGLKHGAAEPTYQKDSSGNQHLGWTTMDLHLPAEGFFFCKYESSVEPRRKRIREEVQANDGGPLGIEEVKEVVVGVRDIAAAKREFGSLLGQSRNGEDSVWDVGNGPSIRLIADKEDHLAFISVKVKSLERARAFLKTEDLLGDDTGAEISFKRSKVGDTSIRLVE